MSSDSKSGIPSNDEVIEKLTKDLRDSAIKTDSCDDNASHISESDSETETETQVNEETEIKDEDYIDDALLKERDEKLPEEEKRVSITQMMYGIIMSIHLYDYKHNVGKQTITPYYFYRVGQYLP